MSSALDRKVPIEWNGRTLLYTRPDIITELAFCTQLEARGVERIQRNKAKLIALGDYQSALAAWMKEPVTWDSLDTNKEIQAGDGLKEISFLILNQEVDGKPSINLARKDFEALWKEKQIDLFMAWQTVMSPTPTTAPAPAA